jgi:tetratricopeptide (TPR) repeat protein
LDLQPADATSWVALASLQAAKGDTEGMKVSLAEAERLEPELGSIYMMRARQCQHEGRLEEALALCAEALRRDPRFSLDSWMLQAELYDSLGKAAEAQAARQHAKELRMPQSPPGGAQTDGG